MSDLSFSKLSSFILSSRFPFLDIFYTLSLVLSPCQSYASFQYSISVFNLKNESPLFRNQNSQCFKFSVNLKINEQREALCTTEFLIVFLHILLVPATDLKDKLFVWFDIYIISGPFYKVRFISKGFSHIRSQSRTPPIANMIKTFQFSDRYASQTDFEILNTDKGIIHLVRT